MSAIQFRTTPKGYLPHYSYIFREIDPLETEMKNVNLSRLGNMLHLDIQKGKEAMKTSEFEKYIGGNSYCMKRLAIGTKGCGQLTANHTYFSDSWFSFVKTTEELMAERVNYCGSVKTRYRGFCLATLEKLMKDWPGGSYLVMNTTPSVPGGRSLLAIRHK